MRKIRCAIYTRKSTEEGLEQDFNSLDAQREACEAYIKSQKNEGWILLDKQYNDGGYSGGTMERPAFKELLQHIKEDKIDIVVVYKVDRLTRSLMDFSKIIDIFDQHQASFVSITQHFNTTTSMGRLTLNILLSFAQFEREVTGERIRDKFAASKKKGLWMGGVVPLGYDKNNRTLKINEKDSLKIKLIFNKYLEFKSVSKLMQYLKDSKIKTKSGKNFSKGNLYYILKNKIYTGKIVHKQKEYNGEHPAIIKPPLFEEVQSILSLNAIECTSRNTSYSFLKGLLYDDKENIMSPSHSNTRKKKYRYYVSQAILGLNKEKSGSVTKIPALEIEKIVQDAITVFLKNTNQMQVYLATLDIKQEMAIIKYLENTETFEPLFIRALIFKVILYTDRIQIIIKKNALIPVLLSMVYKSKLKISCCEEHTEFISFDKKIKIARTPTKGKILIIPADSKIQKYNLTLIKALTRCYYWHGLLQKGICKTITDIQHFENMKDKKYIRQIMSLRFLPPKLQEDILNGTQDVDLSLRKLFKNVLV